MKNKLYVESVKVSRSDIDAIKDTNITQKIIDVVMGDIRRQQDLAFLCYDQSSKPVSWHSSFDNDIAADLAEFYKQLSMKPKECELHHFTEPWRKMMLKEGFDPDKGDVAFIDFRFLVFLSKDTRNALPSWLQPMPILVKDSNMGAYFVKMGHTIDFLNASMLEEST